MVQVVSQTATTTVPLKKPSTITPKATSTVAQKNIVSPKKTVSTQISPAPQSTTSPTISNQSFDAINEQVRKSIVNILCTVSGSGTQSVITGSGAIIDPRGVVLTNAHLAQYVPLAGTYPKTFSCILRTGSPAYPTYNVELLYVSPRWIKDNKTVIVSTDAKGTGEYDFGLLRITGRIDGGEQDTFPYTPVDVTKKIIAGDPVLVGAYPAGFLGSIAVEQYLYPASAVGTIGTLYTFKENTIDLISVAGTVLSQRGSSGGIMVDAAGNVIALISLSSDGTQTSSRDLRGVTLPYINQAITEETGSTLKEFLDGDLATKASYFKDTTGKELVQILTDVIEKK